MHVNSFLRLLQSVILPIITTPLFWFVCYILAENQTEKKMELNKDTICLGTEFIITWTQQSVNLKKASVCSVIFPRCLRLSHSYSHTVISFSITSPPPAVSCVLKSGGLSVIISRKVTPCELVAGQDSVYQVVWGLESVTGRVKQTVSRGWGITDSYTDTSRITGYINSVH